MKMENLKNTKIYGIHRKGKIVEEFDRLGVPVGSSLNINERSTGLRINSSGEYTDFDHNSLVDKSSDYKELTLKELQNVPTPKKKVKKSGWINVYGSSSYQRVQTGSVIYTREDTAIDARGDYGLDTVEIHWSEYE